MIKYACKVFDNMPHRGVVLWNAMVAGYAQKGRVDDIHHLFDNMLERNVVS
jgi:pentatricopeptide repeat protein